MLLSSRLSLADVFEARMNESYYSRFEGHRQEADTNLVKSHMVEAHVSLDPTHDELLRLLRDLIGESGALFGDPAVVRETEEAFFFYVKVPGDSRGEQWVEFHIDASNPRFWLLHSMDKSVPVDWAISQLVSRAAGFDRAWLPVLMLPVCVASRLVPWLGA